MSLQTKISPFLAILISINIVVGGGFFISSGKVSQECGGFALLIWVACGLLLLPLVKVLSDLSERYPSAGGLYIYSQETFGDFWGFVSGWSYFVGTIAGNAMILYAFADLLTEIFPGLKVVSMIYLNLLLVVLFSVSASLEVKILENLNIAFTSLKMIPLVLAAVATPFLFNAKNLALAVIDSSKLIRTVPIALFAYIGIEACCSIAHMIKGKKNSSAKAMMFSMTIIIGIYGIVQFCLLSSLGPVTGQSPFFQIIPKLITDPTVAGYLNFLVKLAILSSFLGGYYAAFYANSWHLYAIAKSKRILLSSLLSKLNKYKAPWSSIAAQAGLTVLILIIGQNNITTLMTMCGFGVVISYFLSVLAFLKIKSTFNTNPFIGYAAAAGTLFLLAFCINDLVSDGLQYFIPFILVLVVGLVIHKKN
jgi:basic amino acid/polyamine antiporter, APA family